MEGVMRLAIPLAVLVVASVLASDAAQAQAGSSHVAALKEQYRRAPPRPIENKALADLGRDLFFDPIISASGKTACGSCHFTNVAWAVLDARSVNDSGKLTSRKSQTLIGLGHMAPNTPIGWDGRNASLEAQAKASIATGSMSMRETPTPVPVPVIEERVRAHAGYAAKFKAALPGAPINIDTIVQAVAAFERTIEPEQAPFDKWVEGDEGAISTEAKRGFELFNGKALCFACHRGWRFTDDLFHDIGTTTTDRGRGVALKDDPQAQFAFKTPTLRSVALRPPYMHNASSATLEDTVRHYEKGGIERPSRSPLLQPIKLTDQERNDLVAFMETLGPPLATSGTK
jgi:cytochrome c peroxidase